MILTKRERLVGAAALAVIAMLVADRFLVSPWVDGRAALAAEKARVLGEISRARDLERRQKELAPRWEKMLASGMATDAAAAESAVLNAVRLWAEESGLALVSLKPEGSIQRGELREIAVQAVGTGPMRGVSAFLWRIESAELPVKVRDLQLAARKEGTDDLSLQVRVAALCAVPAPPKPKKAKKTASEEEAP